MPKNTPVSETTAALYQAVDRKKIPGLDFLRATAVALVILFHCGAPVNGGLGVIVFFVLSGFLITGILQKEISRTGTLSISHFYKRRVYRIFPAFYVCWIAALAIALGQHQHIHWKYEAESFFYLADYGRAVLPVREQITFPMAISWSLAIEEQFYLLWPLLLLRTLSARAPLRVVSWIILGLWLWRTLLILGFHVSWDYAYNAFDTRADALMIGCWVSLAVARREVPRWLLASLSSRWFVLAPLLLLIAGSAYDRLGTGGPGISLVEFTLMPAVTAVLMVQLAFWGSLGWPLLEHTWVQFVARISYSLYLYQAIVIPYVSEKRFIWGLHHGAALLAITGSTLLAIASYYFIEKPFLRLRDRGRSQSVLLSA